MPQMSSISWFYLSFFNLFFFFILMELIFYSNFLNFKSTTKNMTFKLKFMFII